jgi:hypothetical protein
VSGQFSIQDPVVFQGLGFDARTPGGGGRLQLVSPGMISALGLGTLPVLATLTIEFVPEPATAVLVAGGLAALAAAARRLSAA